MEKRWDAKYKIAHTMWKGPRLYFPLSFYFVIFFLFLCLAIRETGDWGALG